MNLTLLPSAWPHPCSWPSLKSISLLQNVWCNIARLSGFFQRLNQVQGWAWSITYSVCICLNTDVIAYMSLSERICVQPKRKHRDWVLEISGYMQITKISLGRVVFTWAVDAFLLWVTGRSCLQSKSSESSTSRSFSFLENRQNGKPAFAVGK